MYGGIIGDTAGSYPEVEEIAAKRSKTDTSELRYKRRMLKMTNELFTNMSSITDDTALKLSILDAILHNGDFKESVKQYMRNELELGPDIYDRLRFSPHQVDWLNDKADGNSYANGCAMKVSPIGFLYHDIKTIKERTREATMISHNHPESFLCAEAVTTSIYYLQNGMSKNNLKDYIEKNYFKLDYDLEDLRRNYTFTSRAIKSVPIAFYAFLKGTSFEDIIRIALSCGGDSDTIASIAGDLAEAAYYDIDLKLIEAVDEYLIDSYKTLLSEVYENGKIKVRRI